MSALGHGPIWETQQAGSSVGSGNYPPSRGSSRDSLTDRMTSSL